MEPAILDSLDPLIKALRERGYPSWARRSATA